MKKIVVALTVGLILNQVRAFEEPKEFSMLHEVIQNVVDVQSAEVEKEYKKLLETYQSDWRLSLENMYKHAVQESSVFNFPLCEAMVENHHGYLKASIEKEEIFWKNQRKIYTALTEEVSVMVPIPNQKKKSKQKKQTTELQLSKTIVQNPIEDINLQSAHKKYWKFLNQILGLEIHSNTPTRAGLNDQSGFSGKVTVTLKDDKKMVSVPLGQLWKQNKENFEHVKILSNLILIPQMGNTNLTCWAQFKGVQRTVGEAFENLKFKTIKKRIKRFVKKQQKRKIEKKIVELNKNDQSMATLSYVGDLVLGIETNPSLKNAKPIGYTKDISVESLSVRSVDISSENFYNTHVSTGSYYVGSKNIWVLGKSLP